MKLRTFFHSFKEGMNGIRRNLLFSIASVGVVTASLFIFGLFFFLSTNIRHLLASAESTVGITVFFEENFSMEEKKELGKEISRMKEVKEVIYISAEEAWEAYKKTSLKPELIETFGDDNPLENSDSYTVFVTKIENQSKVVNEIKTLAGVRKVNSNGKTASVLTGINKILNGISAAILLILFGISIFLISTTISMGISVRKEEIVIMRLIGATDFFVEAPFIIEGILIGLLGGILPLGILFAIYEGVTESVLKRFNTLTNVFAFIDIKTEFRLLVPLILLMGVGIGFIGSFFTVRRHSNV